MQETEVKFKIDQQEYEFDWENNNIIREIIPFGSIDNDQLLGYLDTKNDLLIPVHAETKESAWALSYSVADNYYYFKDLKSHMSESDKIKLCINILDILTFKDTKIIPVVHPNNLLFDINLRPKILHRGIKQVLYPENFNNVFNQIKAFIIMVLSNRYSFDRLYRGLMSDKGLGSPKYRKIYNYKTAAELKEYLNDQYLNVINNERVHLTTTSKKRVAVYRWGFIFMLVLSLILTTVVSYIFLVTIPTNKILTNATSDYLSQDYDRTISDLSKLKMGQMPKAHRLMLAESYVNIDNLNHAQKDNIRKSLNMNSDPNYLKYWIYDGQGNFSQSLDTAKYLGDNQLILFSYTKLYSQANNDPKLTGSKKQKLLNKYSKLIKMYSNKLKKEQVKNGR